jgi:hypothetical protein
MTKLTFLLALTCLATPAFADLDCTFPTVCLPDEPCKDSDFALTVMGTKAAPMIKGPIFEPYSAITIEKTGFYMLLAAPDAAGWEIITIGPEGDAQLAGASAPDMALPFTYRGTCSGELK